MNLLQIGKFTLHSGEASDFKIECDALDTRDIWAAAYLLAKKVPPFGRVEGIPSGGIVLAKYMEEYITTNCARTLVVDDVWTTGGSFREFTAEMMEPWAGAVIFARTSLLPTWLTPLFVMP